MLELAAGLKREHPARTAAHIARIIAAEHGWAPSARTLQRHFARLELSTRPDGSPPKAFGRFEAAACDQLWVSDGLHGPIIDGRRAVLFALLDDHSRYVVGHRWGHGEDTLGMQAALHDAVKTHGCPQRLYCDNGSAYSSYQLAWSAAVLDIKLVHSAPGRPQGRGKIERWNRTVRDQFLVEVDPTRPARRWNSSTDRSPCGCTSSTTAPCTPKPRPPRRSGTTPRAAPAPPEPDPARLRRAFLWREQRKVTSFATVSLHGNRFEVDAALVGRTIDVLFTPFDLTVIEIEYQGRPMGQARPHHVGRHVHPAVKPDATAPVEATGIDYLRLLEDAHQREVGQLINYPALADEGPAEPGRTHDEAAGVSPAEADTLAWLLRAHATGGRLADTAAIDLLISHRHWLARAAFTRFVHPVTTAEGHHIGAWIDWAAAITALQHGELPSSASEADMLRIAASLAHGLPVALRAVLGGLDANNITAVTTAITTANGG